MNGQKTVDKLLAAMRDHSVVNLADQQKLFPLSWAIAIWYKNLRQSP